MKTSIRNIFRVIFVPFYMVPFWSLWVLLGTSGSFWVILGPSESFEVPLDPFGSFWLFLVPFGSFWFHLVPSGSLRFLLGPSRSFTGILGLTLTESFTVLIFGCESSPISPNVRSSVSASVSALVRQMQNKAN